MTVKPLPTVGTYKMDAPRSMATPAPTVKPLKTVTPMAPTPRLPGLQKVMSLHDMADRMHPMSSRR